MQFNFFPRLIISLTLSLTLASCIKPYKIDIQQGNLINPTMANQITQGMTSAQVQQKLGTPCLNNIYPDQIAYVYTLQPGYGEKTEKQLIINFKNDHVTSVKTKL